MANRVKNLCKVAHRLFGSIASRIRITETARVSNKGERIIVGNWKLARESNSFVILAHIQRYEWILPYVKGRSCLDIGCGSGYGSSYLSRNGALNVTGIDVSRDSIRYANGHFQASNLNFLQMDGLDLEFVDASFDVVVSFDVLEHIAEGIQTRLVSEAARVLVDNGALFIGCPNSAVSVGSNPFHKRELSLVEFETMLRAYFDEIRTFGQDLLVDGRIQGRNWSQYLSNLTYDNLVIVEDCEVAYGLLAICTGPRKPRVKS